MRYVEQDEGGEVVSGRVVAEWEDEREEGSEMGV